MNQNDFKIVEQFIDDIGSMRMNKNSQHGLALHKPLTLLYVLSEINSGNLTDNKIFYGDVEQKLSELIIRYGGRTTRSSPNPNLPFYHLNTSPFWGLHGIEHLTVGPSGSVKIAELRDKSIFATLDSSIFDIISKNKSVLTSVAFKILQRWWPETIQSDLLDELGLRVADLVLINDNNKKRKRNSLFQPSVLKNYRNRCAFCGYSAMFNQRVFGLDAAHIMWHAHNGPDIIENGLALCKLHHYAFDRGAIGIDEKYKIMISDEFVRQDSGTHMSIENLKNIKIMEPRDKGPSLEYINWHLENVFLGKR